MKTRIPCAARPRHGAAALIVAALLQGAPALAQLPHSLAQALELAWTRHPQAIASAAQADEARARIEAAEQVTPGAPTVTISQKSDRLGSNRGLQEWELEVSAPLWLPQQKGELLAEGQAVAAGLTGRNAALRLQLAGELREAWWAVAAARVASEVAARRVETAGSLQDDVLRRFHAGDLARTDANLARSEQLAAQGELSEAKVAVQTAEQAWLRLTGQVAPERIDAERGELASAVADGSLPEGHARLGAALAATNLARTRIGLAERYTREQPALSVRAVRDRGDASELYSNQLGVRLSIPFSFGPTVRQHSHAARAELDRAEAELARLREQLQIELGSARRELEVVARQLALAEQRREYAADNLGLAGKAFSLGQSDLATLLRARAAAFEAEAALHRHQIRRELAGSRLRQARGELP